jgi:biofilm PGA synthesis N-glycosyltransferase PgaC
MPVTPADATVLIPRQRAASFTVHGRHHSQTPPSARIAALIPTCNEPAIEATIASVRGQTLPPDHIVVVVNNSTDDTAERARAAGATVVEMTENRHKKSGALNWGYDLIRVRLPDVEYIVQMDADTVLERHFVERTYAVLSRPENWNVGALSSAFIADRGGIIWDNRSLVEDYEVTLALRAMHWDCRKSKKFIAYTDLMPNLSMLWRQRLRWQRGTFDELRRYGWTASTRPDWAKQILHGLLMLAHVAGFAVCFASIGYALWADRPMRVSAWLVVPLGIIACKQAWHIRDMGWRSVLLALLIVPEEAYNLLRHAWWLRGLWLSLRSKQQSW